MENKNESCCNGSKKVEVHVEPTATGVKLEVTPKASACSTTSQGSDPKKSDCGCC